MTAIEDRWLHLTELSLTWGPLELPDPAYSFADDWVEQIYTPEEIAEAILAVPGMHLLHGALPNWDAWAARWSDADRYIDLNISACEFEPDNNVRPGLREAWGGSLLQMNCLLSDVLFVWIVIRVSCPGVCLHDTECRMYSPKSFAETFGAT